MSTGKLTQYRRTYAMDTSNVKEELKQVDLRIEDLNKQIAIGEAIERLHENDDFKLVVIDGYMEAEAERLFDILTTPTSLKRDQLENIMDMLGSIRNFKGYIGASLQNAAQAPDMVIEEENYRKEVTASSVIEA